MKGGGRLWRLLWGLFWKSRLRWENENGCWRNTMCSRGMDLIISDYVSSDVLWKWFWTSGSQMTVRYWLAEKLSDFKKSQTEWREVDFIKNVWFVLRGDADKSFARPRRKQATATTLGIYSTYSPRSSIHFLARSSNLCKPLKRNSEGCPSNQFSATGMTSASDEKWRSFNCFFSPGNRW